MLSDDNFELFTVWYRTQFGQAATADRPQILIVLEDFEAFEPIVLEDLIHILR